MKTITIVQQMLDKLSNIIEALSQENQPLRQQRDKLLAVCEMANQLDSVDNGALYQEWKKKLLSMLDEALNPHKL